MADAPARDSVDELIARIVAGAESPSEEAAAAIVRRVSSAPFSRHTVRVPQRHRGATYGRILLGVRAPSIDYHLAKRVRLEEQWAEGTTAESYLADLALAAVHPTARLLVYERTGDIVAATISRTADVILPARRGIDWLPWLIVVYSARHSVVRTGYMFREMRELDLPERVIWLR